MRLTVQAKPLSKETKLISEPDGTLTMHVAAPPVKGKANQQIVKWISKKLKKPSSQVRIVAGLYSNTKIIEIFEVDETEITQILDIPVKQSED
jgi:uncharacterized protein (TIGR00251 family)